MKLAHQIKLSVFAKPEDDMGLIKKGALSLIPFDIEKEKIELKETKADGFNKKEVRILEIELKKDRHINEFLKSLTNKLNPEQKGILIKQLNSRLDGQLRFFIRLDKDRLLKDELHITDSGNCFHITLSIAAFPARIENAIKILKEIFK